MIKELDFPFTYFWQENSGDAAARNKLIELAKGKYISFIDSDDLLMPDALKKMVNVLDSETRELIVYGSYFRINQNGYAISKSKRKLYSGNITPYLFQTIMVHTCGSMLPKKILKPPLTFDTTLKVCSDYDFWLRLSLKYPFVALAEPTFKRRRHSNNLSVPSFENCLTELNVLKRFYYEKRGKEVVPKKTAMKVFGKSNLRTGRCALREGLQKTACQLLKESFKQHPHLKTLYWWIIATGKLYPNPLKNRPSEG